MSRNFLVSLFCCLMAVSLSMPVYAKTLSPRKIMSSGKWTAYVIIENGSKVCYMVSQPVKEEGKYKRRGDVYALVTHRPSENTKDVFSYIAGYSYKPGSYVNVTIDSKKFKLFTQNDTAWTPDPDSDKKLSAAIRGGSKMIVKGTSSRGTLTKDTISLKGSSAAYKAISKECGIK